MVFSPGDWIATLVGSGAFLRWLVDGLGRQKEKDGEQDKQLARDVLTLESSLRVHEAKDETQFEFIKGTLTRIERRIDNLTRQVGFLAMGTHNKVVEMREDGTE